MAVFTASALFLPCDSLPVFSELIPISSRVLEKFSHPCSLYLQLSYPKAEQRREVRAPSLVLRSWD